MDIEVGWVRCCREDSCFSIYIPTASLGLSKDAEMETSMDALVGTERSPNRPWMWRKGP